MDDLSRGSELADPYELVSIRAAPAPKGASGVDWHRYEIVQGGNIIVGHRDGDLDTVTIEVNAIVTRLNERRMHRRGRVHIALHSKPTAAQ